MYIKNTPFDFNLNRGFSSITIGIASPEQIIMNSYGHVRKPETINYRTFKPERGGLFCSKIFGPIEDYSCLCGKYKKIKHKGIICVKCGVEVITSQVRRERAGHIELVCPVAHPWFSKTTPSALGTLLGITTEKLEKVLYFERYIVIDPGKFEQLYIGETVSEKDYLLCKSLCKKFTAGQGAAAIKIILHNLDVSKEILKIHAKLKKVSDSSGKKIFKKLQLLLEFKKNKIKPVWLLLDVVPVLPPDLRPLVQIEGGKFASSDLNNLYRKIINRNNRLRRLIELDAPSLIIRNEKRMLQDAVDALFDNSRSTKKTIGTRKKSLKSLAEVLKGKEGRFRHNLLGKRVDYSGRSVIVSGPELYLHQCGIPKKMALEIFKPFMYHALLYKGFTTTIKGAKALIEKENAEIWAILEEITYKYPILLNRAPTLHRLGVQAFEPILIEGQAIQLHPLVCQAFNADFDGDQMAVHVPLCLEAQLEARILLFSTNNMLSPANGVPVIAPTKDIILGLTYLTIRKNEDKGKKIPLYTSTDEVILTYNNFNSSLQDVIMLRVIDTCTKHKIVIKTTTGRAILYSIAPLGFKYSDINKTITKKEAITLLTISHQNFGIDETAAFADRLMRLGLLHATTAGVSINISDLVTPITKKQTVKIVQEHAEMYTLQYNKKFITTKEYTQQIIHLWSLANKKITKEVMFTLRENSKRLNPLYLMHKSGARGSVTQILQLTGMRGLISKPDGTIFPIPILANFKEGLSILEYFISTHGARKGLVDTALKTANSGYLTRKLVDVSHSLVILEEDCKTSIGLPISTKIYGDKIVSIEEQINGRTVIPDYITKNLTIRSPIYCETPGGICAVCYGNDLSTCSQVDIGTAVGIIAAQSIGEPGTQLTMRTFHTGGTAIGEFKIDNIKTTVDGIVKYQDTTLINNTNISNNGALNILDPVTKSTIARYVVDYGATVLVKENSVVEKNTIIIQKDPCNIPTIAKTTGILTYKNIANKCVLDNVIDKTTGLSTITVVKIPTGKRPYLLIGTTERHYLCTGMVILVANNTKITAGATIAKIRKDETASQDITQGLLKISDIFEARTTENPMLYAEDTGIVLFTKITEKKQTICIVDIKSKILNKHVISIGSRLFFEHGTLVTKGDLLAQGTSINQKNLLRSLGKNILIDHIIQDVQNVFCSEGVVIDNKHIEIIVRQMLQYTVIHKSSVPKYKERAVVLKSLLKTFLEKTNKTSLQIEHKETILGITKVALKAQSFLSAASFQETTAILANAAIENKTDFLQGLKENVMTGTLVPCGTGFFIRKGNV